MKLSDKEKVVSALAERLGRSDSLYLTDFTGLTVKNMTELRGKLHERGVGYAVVKNTLAVRALKEAAVEGLAESLAGPTGFVFIEGDPVSAAKVLSDFRKEHEDRPEIKAGLLDGKRVSSREIQRLASLPGREDLLAQLGGAMQAPLQGLLGYLNGLLGGFVGVMEALQRERGNAG